MPKLINSYSPKNKSNLHKKLKNKSKPKKFKNKSKPKITHKSKKILLSQLKKRFSLLIKMIYSKMMSLL